MAVVVVNRGRATLVWCQGNGFDSRYAKQKQLGMEFGLIVVFEASEPSESVRKFLKSLNGVEVSGVWFVPNGAPPNLLLSKLQEHLEDSERNEGVAVIRVLRHEPHASIQGFPFLAGWFQRERGLLP